MPARGRGGLRSPKILQDSGREGDSPPDIIDAHAFEEPSLERGPVPSAQPRDRLGLRVPSARLVVEGRRGIRIEDYRGRGGRILAGTTALSGDLSAQLRECILGGVGIAHIFGLGNPMKQDDAVGLDVVSSLRRRLKSRLRKNVKVHGPSSDAERLISDLASRGERIVVIDAVEAQKEPGTIVCARLSETKFGFFATHNVPLRLVPGVAENAADTFVVGIQPESVGVGEGLSDVVKKSSERLVEMIVSMVED